MEWLRTTLCGCLARCDIRVAEGSEAVVVEVARYALRECGACRRAMGLGGATHAVYDVSLGGLAG